MLWLDFWEDVVHVHPKHPQYLGARVKTITATEIPAIATTLGTVVRASKKPPEVHFR